LEFLKEIVNIKLLDGDTKCVLTDSKYYFARLVTRCYGISQDPEGNYVMVMQYIEGGNLRQ